MFGVCVWRVCLACACMGVWGVRVEECRKNQPAPNQGRPLGQERNQQITFGDSSSRQGTLSPLGIVFSALRLPSSTTRPALVSRRGFHTRGSAGGRAPSNTFGGWCFGGNNRGWVDWVD